MTTLIASVLSAAVGAVGAYLTWKASPVRQRRAAEADLKKREEELDRVKGDIQSAVYENDDDKLNQIVQTLMEES